MLRLGNGRQSGLSTATVIQWQCHERANGGERTSSEMSAPWRGGTDSGSLGGVSCPRVARVGWLHRSRIVLFQDAWSRVDTGRKEPEKFFN